MSSDFYERVYLAISRVPSGKLTTYKKLAEYLGSRAYRAVGTALAKNKRAPKVPCHRVVNSDGRLGAYSAPGGIQKKEKLLRKEGILISGGRICGLAEYLYDL